MIYFAIGMFALALALTMLTLRRRRRRGLDKSTRTALPRERYIRAADQARLACNAMVRTMAAGTKFDKSKR
jgi:hypothetical protein